MEEVARSIRVSSTLAPWSLGFNQAAHFLGGLVAGEGSFGVTRAGTFADGSDRKKFTFQLAMASRDRRLLEALRQILGFGSLNDRPPVKAHWQPISVLSVRSVRAHRAAVIPFCSSYLPPTSAKWRQFIAWCAELDSWDAIHPALRVKGTCSEPDCDKPVRGRGVCRTHYYRLTGY